MSFRFNNTARAAIRGEEGITGDALFVQRNDGVLVTVRVSGLPGNGSGFYALHIHEGGSCSGEDFSETGGHYNPASSPHPGHSGDLPPLLDCGGTAYLKVLSSRFTVDEVIGKTIVIHGERDDFSSQPAGSAGKKIACGVIKAGI